mgnify:CR=1 FL=1
MLPINGSNLVIKSRNNYYTKNVVFTRSSGYDPIGEAGTARTIYYPTSTWWPRLNGGSISASRILGHEINHAYDHDKGRNVYNRKDREVSAVNFGNYLRSVYDDKPMRTSYSGLSVRFSSNEKSYNRKDEKVSNFEELGKTSFDGNTFMSFSYKKSENGKDSKTFYMLSVKTKSDKFAYRIFDNKKEYDAAMKRVQKLKKKQDEEN